MKKRKCLICIYAVLLLILTVSCKKVIFTGSDDPLPTTAATKTPTAAADVQKQPENQNPEKEPTQAPVSQDPDEVTPTEAPTQAPATPTPTPVPTEAPTATPVPQPLTMTEAKNLLLKEVGAGYEAENTGEADADGSKYYLFTVSDSAHTYTPQIAVNAQSKEIFYYYSEHEIAEFANFPPDNLESAGGEVDEEQDDGFTSEDAVALLNGLSAAELGLPAVLSEYTILVDEWTTMVYGTECFCVNAYAELENRKQLMGVYFVATDGSVAYRSDMGDFVLIY